jgi:hypothetical protein
LLLDLCFRVARSRVIGRKLRARLLRALLLKMQLLLTLSLVEFQLLRGLALAGVGRWILCAALILQHPELQPVLLLLSLKLVLLERARGGIVRGPDR